MNNLDMDYSTKKESWDNMEILVEKEEPKRKLINCGDLIYTDADSQFYLIMKDSTKGYIARSLNGINGYSGYHNSLDDLEISFGTSTYTLYSQSDYKLVLSKI